MLAFSTATLLIVLVFVGIPLQVAANRPAVVNVVGTLHGLLYIVYLFVAFALTRRLGTPKWQMALVLLAGTVPFAAFVAERKMTRRFDEHNGVTELGSVRATSNERATEFRRRWLSRRAFVLHLEVLIIAPGCVAACWWQATRALGGNGLSWFYSVEWPVFALLAIWGWWYLIHEDPDVYAARRWFRKSEDRSDSGAVGVDTVVQLTVRKTIANLARVLWALVGLEVALGIGAAVLVPVHRPTGWLPPEQRGIYLAHAALGIPLALGALILLARTVHSTRISKLTGWIGMVGVAIAGLGGLLSVSHPLRFLALAVMLTGAVLAGFGYSLPSIEKLRD